MKKGCTSAGGWSHLAPDLLIEIFSHLESVDLIRSRAVCHPWRAVPAETPRKDVWMIFSHRDKPDRHCFYSLNNLLSINQHAAVIKYVINVPQIAGRRSCLGSSQGFLITVDIKTLKLSVVNPLTGAHFPLPATATHPDVYTADGRIITANWIRGTTFHKAIISPSLDTIVVAASGLLLDTNRSSPLSYFKGLAFAKAGDDSWTNMTNLYIDASYIDCITDIIFHKGRLYVLHTFDHLSIIDLQSPNVFPLHALRLGPDSYSMYMTESPDQEDLLLLCEVTIIDTSTTKHAFDKLEVFKLDKSKLEFNQVNDLGEVALFCGSKSYLFSLSTLEHTNLSSNCIYFIPRANVSWLDQRDIGVYNLKDGTMRPLSAAADLRGLCRRIWFTPAL